MILINLFRYASRKERTDNQIRFGHLDGFNHAFWTEGELDGYVVVMRRRSEQKRESLGERVVCCGEEEDLHRS